MVCSFGKRSVCPALSIRRRATSAISRRSGELAQLALHRCSPRGSTGGRTKTLVPPFFDRFSPFSTVFPGGPDRNLFDDSGVRPFFASRAAVRKRWNRRKRSCRLSQLADLVSTLAAENWPAKQH